LERPESPLQAGKQARVRSHQYQSELIIGGVLDRRTDPRSFLHGAY
jgi:hypothetical protein